jgi:hypothetical protein
MQELFRFGRAIYADSEGKLRFPAGMVIGIAQLEPICRSRPLHQGAI